jgi:hypothetical protein
VKKSHSLKANNLMPKYEIAKPINFIKKKTKKNKYEAIMVNLTNLLTWDMRPR